MMMVVAVCLDTWGFVSDPLWKDHLILALSAKDILAPALHIAALAQLKVLLIIIIEMQQQQQHLDENEYHNCGRQHL